jgi:hypothetical protein
MSYWGDLKDDDEGMAPTAAAPVMVRPPWESMNPTGYVPCTCGSILQSREQLREHWQRGHFDTLAPRAECSAQLLKPDQWGTRWEQMLYLIDEARKARSPLPFAALCMLVEQCAKFEADVLERLAKLESEKGSRP